MKDITKALSEYIYDLQFDMLGNIVSERTKLFIADYYASYFAGYRINRKFNEKALQYFINKGGIEEASILFEHMKFPTENAAYINAMYVHGADIDDGNKNSAGHIGTSVISSVFALGETLNVSWKEIVLAINVGYEIFNRVAGAAQPSLYRKGFHATGIAGGLAVSAACAKLLNLDAKGIYNAISLATIQSSGLLIIDESGQSCKPINPANAAKNGIFSADLAKYGIEGPQNPLESDKGWFHAFSDVIDADSVLNDIGKKYTICESYIKLYPTCRHTHSCIDASLQLKKELENCNRSFRDILRIEIYIYPNAIRSAGSITKPKTTEEAKFSLSYAVAVTLFRGLFTLEDLDVINTPQEVWNLIDRIDIIEELSLENREKGIRGSRVKLLLQSGIVMEEEVLVPLGEGNKLISWEDMEIKYNQCAKGIVSTQSISQLVDRCKNLDIEERFVSIKHLLKE